MTSVLRFFRKPTELDHAKIAAAQQRAARAEALLKDEELSAAFRAVESVYMELWRSSTAFENETRERAWVAVKLLDDLRTFLLGHVRDGALATDALRKSIRE